MDQYPLLPLPAPEQGPTPTGRRFPPNNVSSLSPDRQAQRLGPVFQHLADVLSEDRDDLTLRNDPSGLAPERALVLELAEQYPVGKRQLTWIPEQCSVLKLKCGFTKTVKTVP